MSAHDPLCHAYPLTIDGGSHAPDCCDCDLIAQVRADERSERGLANEPQGLALAQMLLQASRSTDTKTRSDLRAKIQALSDAAYAGTIWRHEVLDIITRQDTA